MRKSKSKSKDVKASLLNCVPKALSWLILHINILSATELQHDIAKDEVKYVKKSLKQTSIPSTPSSSGQNSRTASPAPNPKAHLPGRISAAYAELDALSNEKIALSQRIIDLLGRTRSRLDADISKVRLLQGESAEEIRASANVYLSTAAQLRAASPYTKREVSVIGLTPVIQIGDSLRNAVTSSPADNSLSISAAGPGYNKKRRLTTSTSIKLPSPAPQTVSYSGTGHGRSRLSRQSHMSRTQQHHQEDEDLDADAEGEEDVEGEAEDAEDDTTPYCFCQKPSYGDMIGCDNEDCPYQWFHISCVGVKQPLPDKWYCTECIEKYPKAAEKRKGRKK
ncbi:hypothetical protein D9619_000693 [Psilocybe cf. subviscida]|uniref:PHD-type domain-containing protein n=1 Tax=Psilocybe cf. subviscida TaxID=2480587 RepID=A0A8H5F3J8_9AGAR|nr:hypothetical protein D9619_000693 [Psilocybe cf. subviscida]